MSDLGYRPVFAEAAAEFLLQLPKRRQKRWQRCSDSSPHILMSEVIILCATSQVARSNT